MKIMLDLYKYLVQTRNRNDYICNRENKKLSGHSLSEHFIIPSFHILSGPVGILYGEKRNVALVTMISDTQ